TAFRLSATSGMRTAMSVWASSRASVCAATVSGERPSKYGVQAVRHIRHAHGDVGLGQFARKRLRGDGVRR
ncbi:hypothetical protein CTI14_71680, partial [Methylobacterium radiotolerans]